MGGGVTPQMEAGGGTDNNQTNAYFRFKFYAQNDIVVRTMKQERIYIRVTKEQKQRLKEMAGEHELLSAYILHRLLGSSSKLPTKPRSLIADCTTTDENNLQTFDATMLSEARRKSSNLDEEFNLYAPKTEVINDEEYTMVSDLRCEECGSNQFLKYNKFLRRPACMNCTKIGW